MARERSEKCPYASRFAPQTFISAAQWLAESMCDRMARREGLSLPQRFWDTPRWEKAFLLQLRHANALLRLYSVEAIVRALKTRDGRQAYSLGAPFLDPLVKGEQGRFERERARLGEIEEQPLPSGHAPREGFSPAPSLLRKLEG